MFELGYNCEDGGDGSVNVHFFPSREAAKQDEKEANREEWGEPSASSIDLKIEDNTIFFRRHSFSEWVPLKEKQG